MSRQLVVTFSSFQALGYASQHNGHVMSFSSPPYLYAAFLSISLIMAGNEKWNIIIIGAGIGGLAIAISLAQKTAHSIRILERSLALQEVGAGLQITPNASRILCQWGLKDDFEMISTVPDSMQIRRYDNNETVGLIPANIKDYGNRVWSAPHWLVHRVDYQQVLAQTARALGVVFDLGAKVSSVDCEGLVIHTERGSTFTADLVIGADGIHSRTRRSIARLSKFRLRRGVYYSYRTLIPGQKMLETPKTAEIMALEDPMCWEGPLRHIIGYRIAKGEYYNVVVNIPDEGSDAELAAYNQPGDLEEMRREFQGWDDTVTTMLKLAEKCTKWTIAEVPSLPTWSSENSRVVLLGDACHAMTPHAASGAAMTIEDAEVLGRCVARCQTFGDLKGAVAAYEEIRKTRCERVQQMARDNATIFSLPDGPEQEARDANLGRATTALLQELEYGKEVRKPKPDISKPYPHPEVVMWLYGYDAAAETDNYFQRMP